MADHWVKLELDIRTFDAARFEKYLERCRGAGIRLTTLEELGDTPRNRRRLYDLNKECSADIPDRGAFYSYEEYVERRVEVPSFTPRGVVIAVDGAGDGDPWCGMAATSDWRSDGFVFNEMTGVRAACRGRGISIAMKVFGIDFARHCEVDTVRTFHHPANASAIAMNRRLGYVDARWN